MLEGLVSGGAMCIAGPTQSTSLVKLVQLDLTRLSLAWLALT